jgi:hypothetical protein
MTWINMKEKSPTLYGRQGKKVFPILLMASFMNPLLNHTPFIQIPKRKSSTISTRHLVMSQVCRLAMILTDKNFAVCMYQYFCVAISPLLTTNFRIRYTLLLVKTY